MKPTFVIGDIHGHYSALIKLLWQDAQVITQALTWRGADATVVFVGDYVNRGPDGIRVIDFLISLQIQAEQHGGRVIAMQGNHEHMLLSAQRFGDCKSGGPAGSFVGDWMYNGGIDTDLEQLTPEHIAWITHLPAMVQLQDRLIVHGDAMLYMRYGQSVDAVNQAFEHILRSFDPAVWNTLLADFTEHRVFWHEPDQAQTFLAIYGGNQIIHGHSPIGGMTGQPHETVTQALVYADGLCVNVDGGIYRGGPGFVYELSALI